MVDVHQTQVMGYLAIMEVYDRNKGRASLALSPAVSKTNNKLEVGEVYRRGKGCVEGGGG